MRRPFATRDPLVSVVMVTHGAWPWTTVALEALAARTDVPLQLIVVDNASTDETRARLAELDGAEVILNDANEGFGPASNQGAAAARGRLLLLLNSDAIVNDGWLPPLLEALDDDPATAAVVPRFLHLDGSLQEAAALLARDGTVVVHGDREAADGLAYRFRRVVDFGGAACMLIRREAFEEVGGFDDVYAPAYYEDADLCLKLAGRGYRVVYEPRSTVTHVRYASSDVTRAVALSERNRRTFAARWHDALAGRPATFVGAGEAARIAARDAVTAGRVLVVDDGSPEAAGGHVAAIVAQLADYRPGLRVTWVAGALATGALDPEPWLARGVELIDADDSEWLAARTFSYDAVVVGAVGDPRLSDAVLATQPQARRIAADDVVDDVALWDALADAGIA